MNRRRPWWYTPSNHRIAWRSAVFTTGLLLAIGGAVTDPVNIVATFSGVALMGYPAVAASAVLIERHDPRASSRPPVLVPSTLSADDRSWLSRHLALAAPEPEPELIEVRPARPAPPKGPGSASMSSMGFGSARDHIDAGHRRAIEREAELFAEDPAERERLKTERLAREAEVIREAAAARERSRREYEERRRKQQEQDARIAAQIDAAAALHRHRVIAWQKAHGLAPDGIVGPRTRMAMQAALEGAETVVESVEGTAVDSLLFDLGIEPPCTHPYSVDSLEWPKPRCTECGRDTER